MASIRSQIIAAVVSALDGPSKPAGLTVYRFRLSAVDPAKLPAMIVRPVSEDVNKENPRSPVVRRVLRFSVRCFAVPTGGQALDDALDALLAWASKAVLASTTQNGLAINTTEVRSEWDADEAEQIYASATLEFQVEYATKTTDQEAKQ